MRPAADSLFIRACWRQPTPRAPVWMMRQAGRYLPEYRAVRQRASFLELCQTPDLACEVTLQPIDIFGFDAAILFSDILVPLPAMGFELAFPGDGPKVGNLVQTRADVDRLRAVDPDRDLPFVADAVRLIRRELRDRVPLIGFAGAPFTLTTYAVESAGSKDHAKTRALLHADPSTAHALLDKMAVTVADCLAAQIAAGAQAVQLFDSWAGVLAPTDFEAFALRAARAAITRLRASAAFLATPVPIIYFVNGCAPYLSSYASVGADVLGVDWRVDIGAVRRGVGPNVALQGNLDPAVLRGSDAFITERVHSILDAAGPTGHIFNLGHGVTPDVDPARVRAMVAAVHSHSRPA